MGDQHEEDGQPDLDHRERCPMLVFFGMDINITNPSAHTASQGHFAQTDGL